MSLVDDSWWLVNALENMIEGGLPTWPPKWSTKRGERLAELIQELQAQRFKYHTQAIVCQMERDRLREEVSGLRETNQRLTDMMLEKER